MKQDSPLVSIIMPTYNSASTLSETISSIEKQSYKNYELIIIDDGSIDNTEEICFSFDNRINLIYYKQKNAGVSNARNRGLKLAKGKFITFIDSDDLYDKEYLSLLVKKMEESDCQIVSCSYKTFPKSISSKLVGGDFCTNDVTEYIEKTQTHFLFNQIWNKIYLKDIIDKNDILFDEKLSIAEDFKFNVEYIKFVRKISHIDIPLYFYRVSNSGLGFKFRSDSNDIKLEMVEQLEKIYDGLNKNKEYIYRSYVIQYFSYFCNTFNKENKMSKKEKKKKTNNMLKDKVYIAKIEEACKSKNIETRILGLLLNTKSVTRIRFVSWLARIYDMHTKKKEFGI